LGIPGLILQIVGNVMSANPGNETVGALVLVGGTALLIGGLAMYAKAKGRSPVWGFMGFLSLIGLIGLAMLKDRASNSKPPTA
jgi:uncharacterized membrane protein HdeD (DUF308 family)